MEENTCAKRCPWGTIATLSILVFYLRMEIPFYLKVENSTPLKKGTIFVPLGALLFLNNHVYETVFLNHRGTEIVPLRVPYYGQSNSAPRGTVSVPFFSECDLQCSPSKSKQSNKLMPPPPQKSAPPSRGNSYYLFSTFQRVNPPTPSPSPPTAARPLRFRSWKHPTKSTLAPPHLNSWIRPCSWSC